MKFAGFLRSRVMRSLVHPSTLTALAARQVCSTDPDHTQLLRPSVVHGHLATLAGGRRGSSRCQVSLRACGVSPSGSSTTSPASTRLVYTCTKDPELPHESSGAAGGTLLIISGSLSKESGTWKPASFIACQPHIIWKPQPHSASSTVHRPARPNIPNC